MSDEDAPGEPADAPLAAAAPLCPRCKKGVRVPHQYEYGGMVLHSDYCGFCGRNWPDPGKKRRRG